VFAGLRFHPGVNLLHSAAQHVASKLQQATAANSSYRLAAGNITALLQVRRLNCCQQVWARVHHVRAQQGIWGVVLGRFCRQN
jgi:hypothetical protein